MMLAANKKTLMALVILMSLSCLSCASAMDLNGTDIDASQFREDIQNVSSAETPVLSAQDEDGLSAQITINSSDGDDILAKDSKGASNDVASAFLVLDNDADKEDVNVGEYVTWRITVDNLGPGMPRTLRFVMFCPTD